MIKKEIDEKILDKPSHIEIRKRKDSIVVMAVPKSKCIVTLEGKDNCTK